MSGPGHTTLMPLKPGEEPALFVAAFQVPGGSGSCYAQYQTKETGLTVGEFASAGLAVIRSILMGTAEALREAGTTDADVEKVIDAMLVQARKYAEPASMVHQTWKPRAPRPPGS